MANLNDKNVTKQLNNDELESLSGGRFNVSCNDACHYNPPKFELVGSSIPRVETYCGLCK